MRHREEAGGCRWGLVVVVLLMIVGAFAAAYHYWDVECGIRNGQVMASEEEKRLEELQDLRQRLVQQHQQIEQQQLQLQVQKQTEERDMEKQREQLKLQQDQMEQQKKMVEQQTQQLELQKKQLDELKRLQEQLSEERQTQHDQLLQQRKEQEEEKKRLEELKELQERQQRQLQHQLDELERNQAKLEDGVKEVASSSPANTPSRPTLPGVKSSIPRDPATLPASEICLKEINLEPAPARRGFIMVSLKYKFVMCVTPKVGSRSWIDYTRWLHMGEEMCHKYENYIPGCKNFTGEPELRRGIRRSESAHQLVFWEHLSLEKQLEIANSKEYTRFAIHRHPWTRLESAYKGKFLRECDSNVTCLVGILQLKNFPETLKRINVIPGYSTFDAFVDAVVEQSPVLLNSHMKPQSLMCGHDCIPWDYNLDLADTPSLDALTQHLKLPEVFSNLTGTGFPWTSKIEESTVLPQTLYKAHAYYKDDLLRFNYDFDWVYKKYNLSGFIPPSRKETRGIELNQVIRPRKELRKKKETEEEAALRRAKRDARGETPEEREERKMRSEN